MRDFKTVLAELKRCTDSTSLALFAELLDSRVEELKEQMLTGSPEAISKLQGAALDARGIRSALLGQQLDEEQDPSPTGAYSGY